MSHRAELASAIAGVVILAAAVFVINAERLPVRDFVLDDRCHTPVSLIEPPGHSARGDVGSAPAIAPAAVVIHGLSANRRVMYSIGQSLARAGFRAYLLDSPGEGDGTGKFSFAAAESCAGDATQALVSRGEISPPETVLVGHSLGGAIAIRLADRFPDAAGTIAISPAPLVPPLHAPADVLVMSAQFDPPELAGPARGLVRQLGGVRDSAEDFRLRRAVGFERVPLAMHSSVLADSLVNSRLAAWSRQSLGLNPNQSKRSPEIIVLIAFLIGGAGIAATLGFIATLTCRLLDAGRTDLRVSGPGAIPAAKTILLTCLAAVFSAALLIPGIPLRMLHLYSADYLASFLSLTGLLLLVLLPREIRASFRGSAREILAAVILAVFVAVPFALWTNWQFADLWPNAPRALLILPLAAVTWPYFAAEEVALGPLCARSGAARWLFFGAMRLVLLGALALAYFGFKNGEFLPVLMSPAFALVSLGQRAASDLLQRRAPSLAGAATLDAILAAWFLAATFPLR